MSDTSDAPILVVEDNPLNLQLVQALLKRHGYTILAAGDAEEALNILKDHHPALILMDIQLPGMDGLQLTRMLKQNPATKDIIIIALTAYAMKGDEERILAAGCDGYLSKPFDTVVLPKTIASYLKKNVEI